MSGFRLRGMLIGMATLLALALAAPAQAGKGDKHDAASLAAVAHLEGSEVAKGGTDMSDDMRGGLRACRQHPKKGIWMAIHGSLLRDEIRASMELRSWVRWTLKHPGKAMDPEPRGAHRRTLFRGLDKLLVATDGYETAFTYWLHGVREANKALDAGKFRKSCAKFVSAAKLGNKAHRDAEPDMKKALRLLAEVK